MNFHRRALLKMLAASSASAMLLRSSIARTAEKISATAAAPNILFIVLDDLNSWAGCLGGHPDVKTPNIDALAASGTLFANAHSAVPLCNASRVSTLSGLSPLTTHVWYNTTEWRSLPPMKDVITLPQYFRDHGYRSIGSGKIFHHGDRQSWDGYFPDAPPYVLPELVEPDHAHPRRGGLPQYRFDASNDWSAIDYPPEAMPDWKVADWVMQQLGSAQDKPLFLGCGFNRPHQPWYLPKQYFDMYPLDKIRLPEIRNDDLNDVPKAGRAMVNFYTHDDMLRNKQWAPAVQAYLASITFADEQVGRVMQALHASKHADNTLVVLWSDNGFHLGEKLQWRKLTMWEEATHVPLVFAGPGVARRVCREPVSLLDIYPTLIDLAGLPQKPELQGHSLRPLMTGMGAAPWPYAAVSSWEENTHAVRSRDWRYIRYKDGSEELYDHRTDPHEWSNVASQPGMDAVKKQLAAFLPQK